MDSISLSESPLGYERPPELQEQFLAAAEHLREVDGWANPENQGRRELRADLALEGGGVKGIGLVGAILVLSEAGYSFRGVAGTSAGAIAASLVAGISESGKEMTELLSFIRTLDFSNFMPEGHLHRFFDRAMGHAGDVGTDVAILIHQQGIYSGDYLVTWLRPILHDQLGITSFANLKLSSKVDPGLSLPTGKDYRLVVHTSDITRGQLVRLPWDYPMYGKSPDEQDPVDAVRASMSIPFFFEPVHVESEDATVDLPMPGGGSATIHYAAGTQTWVDGGMLANFPIHAFDRSDGNAPRWPTIGIKLSRLQTEFASTQACDSAIAVALRSLRTMTNEWDTHSMHSSTAARTIFVDSAGITATDFDLTQAQQNTLFLNGAQSATNFVIEMARSGGVPRN